MKLMVRFSFIFCLLIGLSLNQHASASSASTRATGLMEAGTGSTESPRSIRTEAALMRALHEAYTNNASDNPMALDAALHRIIDATTPLVLAASLKKIATIPVTPDDLEMPEETDENVFMMAFKIIIKTAIQLYLFEA